MRFRMRSLMLAIAASAVVMGIAVGLWRRSVSYKRVAGDHAHEAQFYADAGWGLVRFGGWNSDGTLDPERKRLADQFGELYDYHCLLREKYERAATRPWSLVPPDPPSPPVP